ncbi:hypothetical protein FRB93_009948 [Tulasnella sp. JGI-2019a]|nr:hypothetical protein FRB93_009948 [Tulasnella sp. JGI-2019a]
MQERAFDASTTVSNRTPSPVTPHSHVANLSAPRPPPALSSVRTFQSQMTPCCFPDRVHVPLRLIRLRKLELVLDVRRGGEAGLLFGVLWLAIWRLYEDKSPAMQLPILVELIGVSIFAMVHPLLGAIQTSVTPAVTASKSNDTRRPAMSPSGTREREMTFLWMTDSRDYSDCRDDGSLTGLLFAPILTSTYWLISLQQLAQHPTSSSVPAHWLIEPPRELPASSFHPPLSSLQSIVLSRRKLVELSIVCSTVLFMHMTYSRWQKYRRLARRDSENASSREFPPKKEGRRSWLYTKFSVTATLLCVLLRMASETEVPVSVFATLSYFDVIIISLCFQFVIYVMIRLAYRGFTLGELSVVATGSTAVLMESVNLTKARIWPLTTAFIETYRSPTPLLIYQIALIPGAFLTGFLLSPILVISRNLAQKPSYRLRFPDQKLPLRKALAGAFYGFTVLIVGGLIGTWTGWCLGVDPTLPSSKIAGSGSPSRNPWMWFLQWLLLGQRPWSRPALLTYWALVASISVAGWSRQLARARKSGRKIINVHFSGPPNTSSTVHSPSNSSPTSGSGVANTDNRARSGSGSASDIQRPKHRETVVSSGSGPFTSSSVTMSHSMTGFLDRADKRVPTLSLNARRKFFHGLAVVMFIPGIALDPAFTHASFSVAFSLFIFVEYVRYFALYPFSATVHVFMNEFINEKDSGTAILSHFYLLNGCAMPIWLEGPSRALGYTGVLALGVGDAVASVVGKRIGRHHWTSNSPKTVEGTIGFIISTVAAACLLKTTGVAEAFSTPRYIIATILGGILEAFSLQNDNLTLPLYLWAALILLGAV